MWLPTQFDLHLIERYFGSIQGVVYASFFIITALTLAVNYRARRTDVQLASISNGDFLVFQRKFFAVYFLALISDWLQVRSPY